MKKGFLLILTFLACNICNAQIFIKSTEQQFIEDAVKNGLFLAKQSYQICDRETGDLFGFRGNKEFGTEYSVGVKVDGGFLLTDKAVRPWVSDEKFAKYADKYDPIFYQSRYKELKPKAEYDSLDCDLTKQKQLADTAVYRFESTTFGKKGFVLDTASGEKQGWIVLVTIDKDADPENADVNYTIYRNDITVDADNSSVKIDNPNADRKILGGIYLVPAYTGIGVLEFRLCGVVAQSGKGWTIYCPFSDGKSKSGEDSVDSDGAGAGDNSDLTPVGEEEETPKTKDNKGKQKKKK